MTTPTYTFLADGPAWSVTRDGMIIASRSQPTRRTCAGVREMVELIADLQADNAYLRHELGSCVEASRLMDAWIEANREGRET